RDVDDECRDVDDECRDVDDECRDVDDECRDVDDECRDVSKWLVMEVRRRLAASHQQSMCETHFQDGKKLELE
ncbi:hypothetical protein, partial [Nostoc sp.]|uniref:hypothetical protein n=1 Tax=Nostoc sp. TaxID=1180 RepID=UPI002FF830B3